MTFTKEEKALLKHLLKQELKEVVDGGKTIRPSPSFLAAEEKYDIMLKNLIKKL